MAEQSHRAVQRPTALDRAPEETGPRHGTTRIEARSRVVCARGLPSTADDAVPIADPFRDDGPATRRRGTGAPDRVRSAGRKRFPVRGSATGTTLTQSGEPTARGAKLLIDAMQVEDLTAWGKQQHNARRVLARLVDEHAPEPGRGHVPVMVLRRSRSTRPHRHGLVEEVGTCARRHAQPAAFSGVPRLERSGGRPEDWCGGGGRSGGAGCRGSRARCDRRPRRSAGRCPRAGARQ